MSKKLGKFVKDARNDSGLTQALLADMVEGLSPSDVSRIESGEKVPEQAVLKQMAKALGVTQTAMLEAAGIRTAAAKTTAAKTGSKTGSKTTSKTGSKTASKTTSKTASKTGSKTASKTTSKTTSKKTAASRTDGEDLTLTATEKKLVRAYRKADSDTKKAAMNLLAGESSAVELLAAYMAAKSKEDNRKKESDAAGLLNSLLGGSGNASSKKEDGIVDTIMNLFGKG